MNRQMARICWGAAWVAMISLMGCSSMGFAGGDERSNEILNIPAQIDLPDQIQAPQLPQIGASTPTFGGSQFWTDQHFFHQWRIQRRGQLRRIPALGFARVAARQRIVRRLPGETGRNQTRERSRADARHGSGHPARPGRAAMVDGALGPTPEKAGGIRGLQRRVCQYPV